MKLKNKILRFGLILFGVLLLGINLAGGYLANHSSSVSAATAPTGVNISVHGNNYNCYSQINPAADLWSLYYGTPDGQSLPPGIQGLDGLDNAAKNAPTEAKQTLKDAADNTGGHKFVYINFDSLNTPVQANCQMMVMLVQSENDPHIFYGDFYNSDFNGHNYDQNNWQYTSATVDAKGVLSFKGYSMPLNNWDPSLVPGGGGSTGVGSSAACPSNKFSEVQNDTQTQLCVNYYAASARFVNFNTIYFGGGTFTANSWGGNTMTYTLSSSTSDPDWLKCDKSSLLLDNTQDFTGGTTTGGHFDISSLNGSGLEQFSRNIGATRSANGQIAMQFHNSNCHLSDSHLNPLDHNKQIYAPVQVLNMSTVAAYYSKDDAISTVFQDGGTNEKLYIGKYVKTATGVYTFQTGGPDGCNDASTKPRFDNITGALASLRTGVTVAATWEMPDSSCNLHAVPVTITMADPNASAPNPAGNGGAVNDSVTCESNGFSLSVFLCPIVEGMASAVDGINSGLIQPLLKTQVLNTTTAEGDKLYKAWSGFRIFGDIFLVIALLVVVFGEAIGGGLIDAYAAKKILPRLLIAAILINLSYYLVGILVDLTNIVGAGVDALIAGPFGQAGGYSLKFNFGTQVFSLGALATSGALAIAGQGALLGFLWAFVLLPALLTFIAIMVTVILRRGLIILLIIVSPVAFALYCLPNTEQYFRRWWELLFRTLLVYPIIEALFAISKVLAVTIKWGG